MFREPGLRHEGESVFSFHTTRQLERSPDVDVECLQVPVVDADHPGSGRDRPVEFEQIMHLDEWLELVRQAVVRERPQLGVRETADNQEKSRGAQDPGFQNLISIDYEVLSQQRNVFYPFAELLQETSITTKETLVGQDRDGGRSSIAIRVCDVLGRPLNREGSMTRAPILDLGDNLDAVSRDCASEVRSCEVAEFSVELLLRNLLLESLNLLSLRGATTIRRVRGPAATPTTPNAWCTEDRTVATPADRSALEPMK